MSNKALLAGINAPILSVNKSVSCPSCGTKLAEKVPKGGVQSLTLYIPVHKCEGGLTVVPWPNLASSLGTNEKGW